MSSHRGATGEEPLLWHSLICQEWDKYWKRENGGGALTRGRVPRLLLLCPFSVASRWQSVGRIYSPEWQIKALLKATWLGIEPRIRITNLISLAYLASVRTPRNSTHFKIYIPIDKVFDLGNIWCRECLLRVPCCGSGDKGFKNVEFDFRGLSGIRGSSLITR